MWTIAQQEDCKILYFHTKGVFNDYVDPKKDDISDLKIKTIRDWRKYMEYFCIDKWQENLNKLDEFDMVGSTCNSNWWWGNFWWATSKYLRTRPAPGQGSRWAYEAWSNENGMANMNTIIYRLFYTIQTIQKSFIKMAYMKSILIAILLSMKRYMVTMA